MTRTTPSPPLPPPSTLMRMERLGAFYQTRLSFVRTLVRRMAQENWQIVPERFELDDHGYGTAVYKVTATNDELYSVVLFSQYIRDDERTDRVIAEKWDIAAVLCEGIPDEARLAELRHHVPKQEAGRNKTDILVLSRANKSGRNFNTVVDCLARGRQPDVEMLKQVGYLVRTTAVYGNGKFGLADYAKLSQRQAFNRTFSAQMFTVFMIRHFASELVEHIAKRRSPDTAVSLDPQIRKYLGVGNATGLGMAPFLVKHPKLLHSWIHMRETAIAHVVYKTAVTASKIDQLDQLLEKAKQHLAETTTGDERQRKNYHQTHQELQNIQAKLKQLTQNSQLCSNSWKLLVDWTVEHCIIETQELLNSLLLELYPDEVDALEQQLPTDENAVIDPEMTGKQLKTILQEDYQWATRIDFDQKEAQYFFWYRSAEKEEPRLGERFLEPGAEKEQHLDIAREIVKLNDKLNSLSADDLAKPIIYFLIDNPKLKGIVRRIQSLKNHPFGEIQDNLIDINCLPIHMLRCKLSFFGASKFDPKSRLWTRITLFQGAPLIEELSPSFNDRWAFPVAPN